MLIWERLSSKKGKYVLVYVYMYLESRIDVSKIAPVKAWTMAVGRSLA